MKKVKIIILSIGLMAVVSVAQTPQEAIYFLHDENGVGIKAQSMGNAFVGVANDYSAIYWNPAGLTRLETSEIDGSLYHLKYNNTATYLGSTILDDRTFTKLHSLGLAYKFPTSRGSFVLAFGYNRFKNYDEFLYFSGFSRDSINLGFDLEDDNGDVNYYPFSQDVQRTEEIRQGEEPALFCDSTAASVAFHCGRRHIPACSEGGRSAVYPVYLSGHPWHDYPVQLDLFLDLYHLGQGIRLAS